MSALTELRMKIAEAKSNSQDTSYLEQLLEQAKDALFVDEYDDKAMLNTSDEEIAYI